MDGYEKIRSPKNDLKSDAGAPNAFGISLGNVPGKAFRWVELTVKLIYSEDV